MKARTILFWALLSIPCHALANYVWVEEIDGLLSSDNFMPTLVGQLQPGSNMIAGTVDVAPSLDPDFFTFEIPNGNTLTQIVLNKYDTTQSNSFFGIESGTQISDLFGFNLMGGALIGGVDGSNVGDNILDDISGSTIGNGTIDGSLGPGTYTVWFQEQGGVVDYEFDFQVVPEPSYPIFLFVCFFVVLHLRNSHASILKDR